MKGVPFLFLRIYVCMNFVYKFAREASLNRAYPRQNKLTGSATSSRQGTNTIQQLSGRILTMQNLYYDIYLQVPTTIVQLFYTLCTSKSGNV